MDEIQNEAVTDTLEGNEEWDEEDYDEDVDDADIAAEAEEIARRLGEELWADINKANKELKAASSTSGAPPAVGHSIAQPVSHPAQLQLGSSLPHATLADKTDATLATIQTILSLVEKDTLAQSTLHTALVPTTNGENVLDILRRMLSSRTLDKHIAMSLSQILLTLAGSEVLFGTPRQVNAGLEIGKRKRADGDVGDPRVFKRPYHPGSELQQQVTDAVHVISQALGSTPTGTLDPTVVASIRLQLHQVFLFAVTSSTGGGHDMNALQEISGLIQVIGVLSGIQIGQPAGPTDPQLQTMHAPNPADPWPITHPPSGPTDIGTAVYPCLVPNCRKVFSRLFSLRNHQRLHAKHRPYRCHLCPASFARNHDLKRHVKLHDKKAWKCCGCHKIFSRRDAIKRHKNGIKGRNQRNEQCVDAEVLEVELDDEEKDESAVREERRAKLWNGIAVNEANATLGAIRHRVGEDGQPEEGELQPGIVSAVQSAVMSLHGLLQSHVGNALGQGQTINPPADPTGGQATLASVIARAQMMNMPSGMHVPTPDGISTLAAPTADVDTSTIPTNPPADSGTVSIGPDMNSTPSLSMYGLSDEQTKLLEQAIANAASAAQAQAEAEAALEEEEDDDYEDEEYDGNEDLAEVGPPS